MLGVVHRGPDGHRQVRNAEEEGVQRADVVDNVGIVHREAEEEDEEVHAPYHLQHTEQAEVLLRVEEREVPKPGHPEIACDVHPDVFVGGLHLPVVILDEEELHPTLPLFRLLAVQEFCARGLPHREEREHQHHTEASPVHGRAVELLRLLGIEAMLAEEAEEEDNGKDAAATQQLKHGLPKPVDLGPMQGLHVSPKRDSWRQEQHHTQRGHRYRYGGKVCLQCHG
mmetsp:Transcript_116988/g.342623  ORF Transcript_116988/g.342623 Transcript_116988/m.342623 type:complete len:226 (-) Transcript_116988:38-715(-)